MKWYLLQRTHRVTRNSTGSIDKNRSPAINTQKSVSIAPLSQRMPCLLLTRYFALGCYVDHEWSHRRSNWTNAAKFTSVSGIYCEKNCRLNGLSEWPPFALRNTAYDCPSHADTITFIFVERRSTTNTDQVLYSVDIASSRQLQLHGLHRL